MILSEIILKKFLKNKFVNILNIIELIISFIAIIILTGLFLNLKFKIDSVREIISLDNIKGSITVIDKDEINNPGESIFVNTPKYLNKIYDYIKDSDNYKISRYQVSSVKDLYLLKIDNRFFNSINFKLSKGRFFYSDEILNENSNEEINVLISKDLEEKYPLGSTFDMMVDRERRILRVIGILEDQSKFWINDDTLVDIITNCVIMQSNYFIDSFDYICSANEEASNKSINLELIDKINSFNSDQYKVTLRTDTVKELIFKKINNEVLKLFFLGLFTVALIILVIIGIKSIFEIEILNSKKDFGIHYSIGATSKHITIIIIGEILIDLILSIIVSLIIVYIFRGVMKNENSIMITFKTYVYSFAICIIMLIYSVISALHKFRKLTPIELIRSKRE